MKNNTWSHHLLECPLMYLVVMIPWNLGICLEDNLQNCLDTYIIRTGSDRVI